MSAGDPASRPEDRQIICGMVAGVDMGVLQLLLALAEKDMLASTLIVYHSDNGGFVDAGSLNLPFRGQKATVFEGGIRVPAFLYGNGLHAAHSLTPERSDLVHVSDILPTVLQYAGLYNPDNSFDGYDHWSRLVTGRPLERLHVPVNSASSVMDYFSAFVETFPAADGSAPTWKYAYNPSVAEFYMLGAEGDEYVPEGEFLFLLSEDPSEEINLVDDPRYWQMLQYMRVRTLYQQFSSVPSQLERMPPDVREVPPSPLGCWLPEDSPQYHTFVCPITRHEEEDNTDDVFAQYEGSASDKKGMVLQIGWWGAIVDPYIAS